MKNKGSSLLFVIIIVFVLSVTMLTVNTYILNKYNNINIDYNKLNKNNKTVLEVIL